MAVPEPTVTAIVTVRDGERYLAAAIESILAQTHRPAQILIVDNGSSDGSAEIARGFGPAVSVVLEAEHGIGHARNAGMRAAAGDFIGFLDHDDLWEPEKTERQLAAFASDPGLDLVSGHVRQFVSPELGRAFAESVVVPPEPQPGQFLGAVLAPRRSWDLVGPWRVGAPQASDGLEWFVRAGDLGLRAGMLAEVVTRRRIHGANQSFGNHDDRSEWPRLLKASLDRRRGAGS